MLATADALIKQFGKRVKVTHTDGATTSAFGVITRPSSTLMQATMMQAGGGSGTSVIDDSLVCWLQGSMKRAPEPGDIIKIGVHSYTVISVSSIEPDGTTTYAYAASVRN